MASNQEQVVVATVGDRRFTVPRRFTWFHAYMPDDERFYELDATVVVGDDGRPRFSAASVRAMTEPLEPLDLQRMPWAKLMEAALEDRATVDGERDPRGVRRARDDVRKADRAQARAAARTEQRSVAKLERQRVTAERLHDVVRLRAEASTAGARRWDTYVADRMHLSPNYVRRLHVQAKEEGIA